MTSMCFYMWWQFSHFIVLLFVLHIQDARVLFWHRTATLSTAVHPCSRRLPSAASSNQGSGLHGDRAVQRTLQLGLKHIIEIHTQKAIQVNSTTGTDFLFIFFEGGYLLSLNLLLCLLPTFLRPISKCHKGERRTCVLRHNFRSVEPLWVWGSDAKTTRLLVTMMRCLQSYPLLSWHMLHKHFIEEMERNTCTQTNRRESNRKTS